MKSMLKVLMFCVVIGPLFGSGTLGAAEFVRSYEFVVDEWHEIGVSDGPVELHRIRIDRKEGRLTKATLARPYNQSYLEPVRFQLEYSNGSSEKWRARVTVRWLDEEGRIIDGFSANEVMGKKSAHKVTQASVSTLKYGLDEGSGFDYERYMKLDKARLFDAHGRGVMLASATLELTYTPPGNRVTVRLPLEGENS